MLEGEQHRQEPVMEAHQDEQRLLHQGAVLDAFTYRLEVGHPCPLCGEPTVHFRGDTPGRDWCTLCEWDPPQDR
jgi:hypothetical protein